MQTPGLDELSRRVAGPGIHASLDVNLGQAVAAIGREHDRRRQFLADMHSIPFPAVTFPVVGGALTVPPTAVLLGPEDGQVWDIRRVSLAGLTAAAPAGASTTVSGQQTSPGAAATIAATGTLPAGTYLVQWTAVLSGTLGAGDANNLQLTNGATQVATSLNAGAAGTYVQQSATVVVPAGGAIVAVKSIAAATVGGVYAAQLTAAPQATLGDSCKLYREMNTPTAGNPQNFLHKFTEASADWEPGGGVILHSPDTLILAGSGLSASGVVMNLEGVQFAAKYEADYLI